VRHNTCADLRPPNVFPGSDALVTTPSKRSKNFDALSPKNELWEVKTGGPHGSQSLYLLQLRRDSAEIRKEKSIADECGNPYVFAASDPVRLSLLRQEFLDLNLKLVDC
jgi:hypothetical protein